MKLVNLEDGNLTGCVRAARRPAVVLTRRGKPVAVVIGIRGMDLEQVELSLDSRFWKMIEQRRKEPTISHGEMLGQLDEWDRQQAVRSAPKKKKTAKTV